MRTTIARWQSRPNRKKKSYEPPTGAMFRVKAPVGPRPYVMVVAPDGVMDTLKG